MRAILSAFSAALVLCGVMVGQTGRQPYAPGELLIRFKDGVSSKRSEAANRSVGSDAIEVLGGSGVERVRLPDGKTVEQAMAEYRNMDSVSYVQPNFYYRRLVTPNDPQFSSMYGLAKISAPAAWDLTTGSSSVVVANIDSGIRYTHPDLAANIWTNSGEIAGNGVDDDGNGYVDDYYGWDFYFNDADPIDLDNGVANSHGTHTAGIIGAVGNNMTGVVGVNWNVKIMNIKIFNNIEYPNDTTTSAMLVRAYDYVRMMKLRGVNVRVTNNSFGGCSEACGYDQATRDAIEALGAAGVLNVFSAGNDASNSDLVPSYPASYTSPSVVAVASSDANDNRSGFSNYGAVSVDLAAPGSGILSTVPTGYSSLSGTSMAGPHVAGAAALLSAYNPSLSVASLKATLLNNVDVLPGWSGLVKTGGRLNVDKALRNQTVCTFNVGAGTVNAPTRGGVFTINVVAPQNCDYSAAPAARWISILDPTPLSGNGTVRFRVTVNPAITRTGVVKIGEQTITVRQSRGQQQP